MEPSKRKSVATRSPGALKLARCWHAAGATQRTQPTVSTRNSGSDSRMICPIRLERLRSITLATRSGCRAGELSVARSSFQSVLPHGTLLGDRPDLDDDAVFKAGTLFSDCDRFVDALHLKVEITANGFL